MLTKEQLLKLKEEAEAEKTKKVQLETKYETVIEEIKTKFEVNDSKELLAKMKETETELKLINQDLETKSEAFREKWDV